MPVPVHTLIRPQNGPAKGLVSQPAATPVFFNNKEPAPFKREPVKYTTPTAVIFWCGTNPKKYASGG